MSILEITSALKNRAYEAAKRDFEMAFPRYCFPHAYRDTLAYLSPDTTSSGRDSLITLRCCLDRPPGVETVRPFFIGLRFSRFGQETTLDLISLPREIGRDHLTRYAWRFGWLSFADRIDTQQGSRPIPSPLISAGGQMTIRPDQTVAFSMTKDDTSTLFGVDSVRLAETIATHFDILSAREKADTFFSLLLGYLREYQGKPDFYEQFALSLHECCVEFTPELAEALYSMKAADLARTQKIDLCTAYLGEIYGTLGTVINGIQAVQHSWT